jgi:predicted DNA-binding transcriptional regulator AlpA
MPFGIPFFFNVRPEITHMSAQGVNWHLLMSAISCHSMSFQKLLATYHVESNTDRQPQQFQRGDMMQRQIRKLDQLHDDTWITNRETASMLGVSIHTCWRWEKEGIPGWPPAVRYGPKTSRRRLGDVRAFLAQAADRRMEAERQRKVEAEARQRVNVAQAKLDEARGELEQARTTRADLAQRRAHPVAA